MHSSPLADRTRRPSLTLRHSLLVRPALLLAAALVAAAPLSPPAHVRNFGEVNSEIFRGAAPTDLGLQELASAGVKLIVDLREPGSATIHERAETERLGMKYVNVPFQSFSAPTPAQVRSVLLLMLDHPPGSLFVHCRRGKDRTGTVVACYRIQHDGWKNQAAIKEADRFGMSRAELGMRSFILHFSPATLAVLPANSAGARSATQP